MPLKKSEGNMYQGWVTHTHSHLAGPCPHQCSYCYVRAMARRFPAMAARYGGELRLVEEEFRVNYGAGRTIFIEHLNDLWAEAVPASWIERVLAHCRGWNNTYVFQTKNPERYYDFIEKIPHDSILGTTIETNKVMPDIMQKAPAPELRYNGLWHVPRQFRTFVTIEPILKFDLEVLVEWLCLLRPNFINIGADSKGHGLPEPTGAEVRDLIAALQAGGIEVRQKTNLVRLLG